MATHALTKLHPQIMSWVSGIYEFMHGTSLISRPEEGGWFQPFAQVLNHSGIPPLLHILSYTYDAKIDTTCYTVRIFTSSYGV